MTSCLLRGGRAAVLALALSVLLGAATAHATLSGVSATAGPDPHEDVPFALDVRGYDDGLTGASLFLADAGHDCAFFYNHGDLYPHDASAGPFAFTTQVTMDAPGSFDVCTRDWHGFNDVWVGHVDVRAARGSIGIAAPRIAPEGGALEVAVRGSSELPEQLYLDVSDTGPCYERNVLTSDDIGIGTVSGSFTERFRVPTPDDGPLYLCGYVQEGMGVSDRVIARTQVAVLVSVACGRDTRHAAGLRAAARRARGVARTRLQRRLAVAQRARRRSCRA